MGYNDLDFDKALEELQIETSTDEDIHSKIEDEIEENNKLTGENIKLDKVNILSQSKVESKKLYYGLTPKSRSQAVYEFIVPKQYENATFDKDKIWDNLAKQHKKNNAFGIHNLEKYTDTCCSILSTIRMGKLPDTSYLIGAPNGFGKLSFVMESLMTLRDIGYKVTPYISLYEISELRVANEQKLMKPYRKFEERVNNGSNTETVYYTEPVKEVGSMKSPELVTGRFSFSEYMNSDCLFTFFTDPLSKEIESYTLKQILSIRGVKGLPTITMISTSLEPYTKDVVLKEQVWDEILAYKEQSDCYDRVYHISAYKKKNITFQDKELADKDTGVIS